MKKDIHPKYTADSKVTCGCGNTFAVGSVMPEIKVEVCSKCHPFFSGDTRIIDSGGRVDRFKKRMEAAKK